MKRAFALQLALRYAVGFGVSAAFATAWAALQRWGFDFPWLVFVPAIVLYIIAAWTFEPIFSTEAGRTISERRFSALRIGVALLLVLPYIAVLAAVSWVI